MLTIRSEKVEKSIGFEMRNIHNLVKRKFSNVPGVNLQNSTCIHGWIVEYLIKNKDKDIFQRDFEEKFAMRRSTASRMLRLMEDNNMIIRQSVGQDARLKKIVLTDKAQQMHEVMMSHFLNLEEKMRDGISEEDLKIFFAVIDQVKKNLE